jgi:hypothetical protein
VSDAVFALEQSGPVELGPPAPAVARTPSAAPSRRGAPQVVTPAPRDVWSAVVAQDRAALPEHAPAWTDALCAHGPYADASRLYTFPDGRRFVLPLVRRTGLPGLGGVLLSYPSAWGMGGLVGSGVDTAVTRAVLDDLRATGSLRVGIRPDPTRWPSWAPVTDGLTLVPRRAHVVDLDGGSTALWQRLSKSARRGVRAAERTGVRVEVQSGEELLGPYYRLYLLSVDRWAASQHEPLVLARARARRRDPLPKLRALARHLGEDFVVTLAHLGGVPVFGSITVLGQTAHDIRAAMDRELVGRSGAGDLVQWTTLELACARGCRMFHLGESGRSTNLAQFKEKFGAEPYDYAEIRVERLPLTRADQTVRSAAKRLLGFRDV